MIVVGARCAGSPLATILARAGMKVCLVDRAKFPSDTPSTHGIQPSGVKILDRLGVLDALLAVTEPVENALLVFDDIRIELRDLHEQLGAPMLNVRRVTLDAILLEAAAGAGVDVRTGTTVTGMLESAGRVVGVQTAAGSLRAALVVGADGARSTVARLVGAAEYETTPARRVFMWGYFRGVRETRRQVWLGQRGDLAFLASPTDSGLFIAAVVPPMGRWRELRRDRTRHYTEGLGHWPELEAHLEGSERVGPVQMMSRWHGFFRESAGPGWALVGDAGHFKDPTPGQGISDSLRQAVALASAIERALGSGAPDAVLREWWSWRDRDSWEMYWFAKDMGSRDRAPLLTAAIEERIAGDPRLAHGLMRVLNHDLQPSAVFSPRLGLAALSAELLRSRGRRRALLVEALELARDEARRGRRGRRL